ncbi:MAG: hypothetical protein K2H86_03400 [Muribaculaceae bacterium]|nr:hypothetical protein [Muribaculaceae bacterium]
MITYTSVGFCVAIQLHRQCEKPLTEGWQLIQTPTFSHYTYRYKLRRGIPQRQTIMRRFFLVFSSILLICMVISAKPRKLTSTLKWDFTPDGTLVISGNGAMPDWPAITIR